MELQQTFDHLKHKYHHNILEEYITYLKQMTFEVKHKIKSVISTTITSTSISTNSTKMSISNQTGFGN